MNDIEISYCIEDLIQKDECLDNWLQGEAECPKKAYFFPESEKYAQDFYIKENPNLNIDAATVMAEYLFKMVRAYFIWKKKCGMRYDWHFAEKSLENEIIKKTKKILKSSPYLSQEQALQNVKSLFYEKIKFIAEKKYLWVSERAYYLSQENPSNPEDHNWYLATQEFEKCEWISKRAYYLSQENSSNSEDHNWYLATQEFEKCEWISKRAYYLSQENPSNPEDYNWYLATQEFEKRIF